MADDAARVVERGGLLGGCCAPSAAKTKGNAASGRIRTRFCRHCRTCVHANYLRHDSSINACWEMGCCLHRFLISSPNLRIDAGFSPFIPSFVHRFLISGGQFGNRCKLFPSFGPSAAVILDFRGSIWESLHRFARKPPPACSDS